MDVLQLLAASHNEGGTTKGMDRAAHRGHFEVARSVHGYRGEGCTTRAIDWAAAAGHLALAIVQFLIEHQHERFTYRGMFWAAREGHADYEAPVDDDEECFCDWDSDHSTEGCMFCLSNLTKQINENPEHLKKLEEYGNQLIDEHIRNSTKNATAPPPTDAWAQHHQGYHNAKKSLFIGINYYNTKGKLRGCIKDVENLSNFVLEKYGFPTNTMRKLTDDGNGYAHPTRANIISGMRWLVQGAKAGDSLVFFFSGHGSRVKDMEGDEADGMDETICPVDYTTAGMITDDEMHAILCAPLSAGVKLTAIFDCCHSGSALDLPFTYTIDGNLQIHEQDNRLVAVKKFFCAGLDFLRGDTQAAKRGFQGAYSSFSAPAAPTSGPVAVKFIKNNTTKGDVVLFSGCMDSQTSADAVIDGEPTGAMTYAFISALKEHSMDITYTELLRALREFMLNKY
ncbi:hypothetical protein SDRG_13491 [Saprolegnia diclina VS20]|uniref:Peptidase C14 caspase domain-containing protein n=1 Tax=Saprolegnia diclina (strain VS20) TaxID=1156394 RepID=T0Q5U2_SAPDV|nr:hypothetical protein SDRG_13491 [Saprolegnia diclina VS20]EQC28810.1 hypothetical protein SDRG_13491 [Saprolegnia diclina VS20]|eukprot:XP_008617805.1 hypothetical protein SDRG_13491 [Saprolegnia diclina VS20]